jgi:hypothetical protein
MFEIFFRSFENRNQILNAPANTAKGQKGAALVAAGIFAVADPRKSRLFCCRPRSTLADDCQPGGHCDRIRKIVRKVGTGKSKRSALGMSREKALVFLFP